MNRNQLWKHLRSIKRKSPFVHSDKLNFIDYYKELFSNNLNHAEFVEHYLNVEETV